MLKKVFICLSLLMILLVTAACNGAAPADPAAPATPPEVEAEIIGVVNGENIYRYEYDFYFNTYFNEYFTSYYDTLKYMQGVDLLDEESAHDLLGSLEDYSWQSTVDAALIRQMAREDYELTIEPSYYEDLLQPAYSTSINTNRLYSMLYPLVEQEAQAAQTVSEEEVRAAYDSDPTAWDCRQAAHIIVAGGEDWDAAKAKMEDIIAQLDAGADFAELAAQYGEDSTKDTGGVMDLYFNVNGGGVSDSAQSFDPAFAAGTFALQNVGDYSAAPVESSFGYHVIKLVDKKEGFEAVRDYIAGSMQTVTTEDVAAFFQQKLDEKEAVSTIDRQLEFKYFVE